MIPINVDKNASKADFREMPVNTLLVTKTFYTFQGEGPFAGFPAVFIRLAGCNIGAKVDCPWCDTRFNLSEGRVTDFEELAQVLDKHPLAKVVVITGGEPLLQHNSFCCFMDYFRNSRPYRVLQWQMETNGLLLRQQCFQSKSGGQIHYVVSPKIPANSGAYKSIPKEWSETGTVSLKYVVTADESSPYHHLPPDLKPVAGYAGLPVYVSGMCVYRKAPTGVASIWNTDEVDQQATAANYAHAARLALQHGFHVSYQTHLFGEQE